jgi:hypothetical protein
MGHHCVIDVLHHSTTNLYIYIERETISMRYINYVHALAPGDKWRPPPRYDYSYIVYRSKIWRIMHEKCMNLQCPEKARKVGKLIFSKSSGAVHPIHYFFSKSSGAVHLMIHYLGLVWLEVLKFNKHCSTSSYLTKSFQF